MIKALLFILLVLFQINLLKAGPWQNPDGKAWTTVDSINYGQENGAYPYYMMIRRLDSMNCIAYATPAVTFINSVAFIKKSTDGGYHWETIKKIGGNNSFNSVRDMAYISPKNILVACDSGMILRTTDGGINWTEIKISLETFHRGAIHLEMNGSWGFIFYAGVGFYRTLDSGESWEKLKLNLSPSIEFANSVKIIDSNYCILLGYDNSTNPDVIREYYTTDKGDTWTHLRTVIKDKPIWGYFVNKDILFFIRNDFVKKDTTFPYFDLYRSTIMRSNDGGVNWSDIWVDDGLYYNNQPLIICDFISESIGVASRGLKIYLTKDGGYSWGKKEILFNGVDDKVLITDAKFLTSDRFIVASGPRILMYDMNSTGVDDDNEKDKLNIYPNPATDYVRIENTRGKEICIYDVLGRQYPVRKVSENAGGVTLDTGTLEPGTYFITVQGKAGVQAVPVVVR